MAIRPTLWRPVHFPVPLMDAERPVPIADADPGTRPEPYHSRSPRRPTQDEQPVPDSTFGLSVELSRIMDEALLLAIVEPELRQCPELAVDFQIFDRAVAGSHEQTLKFL